MDTTGFPDQNPYPILEGLAKSVKMCQKCVRNVSFESVRSVGDILEIFVKNGYFPKILIHFVLFSKTHGKTWDLWNSEKQWKNRGVQKVSKSGGFSQKRQKWHFRKYLWGLGRHFRRKCHFWQVGFWPLKSGGFDQVGILTFWLYPKEAWWTGPTVCQYGWRCRQYGWWGGWYPGSGVRGHGADLVVHPWYGSGLPVPTVTPLFPPFWVIFWPFLGHFLAILGHFLASFGLIWPDFWNPENHEKVQNDHFFMKIKKITKKWSFFVIFSRI